MPEIITLGKVSYVAVEDPEPFKTSHCRFPSRVAWAQAKAFANANGLNVLGNHGFQPSTNIALFDFEGAS